MFFVCCGLHKDLVERWAVLLRVRRESLIQFNLTSSTSTQTSPTSILAPTDIPSCTLRPNMYGNQYPKAGRYTFQWIVDGPKPENHIVAHNTDGSFLDDTQNMMDDTILDFHYGCGQVRHFGRQWDVLARSTSEDRDKVNLRPGEESVVSVFWFNSELRRGLDGERWSVIV